MVNDTANAVSKGEGATQDMRNARGGAVFGTLKWYVAIVKPRYERICRDELQGLGHEAYIASQTSTRVYACRHRRDVERIIIPNVVFVHTTEPKRRQMLRESNFIHHFLTNRAAQPSDHGHSPLAVIPEPQMEMLRFMLYHADRPVEFTDIPLHTGDRIRVIRGAMASLEGEVVALKEGDSPHIGVRVDFLGYATLQVSPDDVERIA